MRLATYLQMKSFKGISQIFCYNFKFRNYWKFQLIFLGEHVLMTASGMYYIFITCNKKRPTKITKNETLSWPLTVFIEWNWHKIYEINFFELKTERESLS